MTGERTNGSSFLNRPQKVMAELQQSGLLSLPYESREIIYQLLLISDEWIVVISQFVHSIGRHKLDCYRASKRRVGWAVQFFRVCKLFYAEAPQLLYGCNKFKLSFETLEHIFLPTIGTRNASFIR